MRVKISILVYRDQMPAEASGTPDNQVPMVFAGIGWIVVKKCECFFFESQII